MFNFFFPKPKTDVELVIAYIFRNRPNNICETTPLLDQSFNLGSFIIQFGKKDTLCQLKLKGDKVPMFMIDDAGDIFAIRRAIGLVAVSGGGCDD